MKCAYERSLCTENIRFNRFACCAPCNRQEIILSRESVSDGAVGLQVGPLGRGSGRSGIFPAGDDRCMATCRENLHRVWVAVLRVLSRCSHSQEALSGKGQFRRRWLVCYYRQPAGRGFRGFGKPGSTGRTGATCAHLFEERTRRLVGANPG